MNIHIPSSEEKPINYTRGYSKQILCILNEMISHNPKLQEFYKLITELHTLAHRENINNPLYLFSRRQKAQVAKILTELYYEQGFFSKETYEGIKRNLNLIFF